MVANDYKDIINNPHHTSKTQKRMSNLNRAAQFAPFAALTGYEASIYEAARLTENRIELDDKEIEILNMKLNFLKEHIKEQPEIKVIYFVKDTKKDGGAYVEYSGTIMVINGIQKTIIFTDRTTIKIEMILDIQGEILKSMQ